MSPIARKALRAYYSQLGNDELSKLFRQHNEKMSDAMLWYPANSEPDAGSKGENINTHLAIMKSEINKRKEQ